MGFLKKLKKRIGKAAQLYGKIGGLVGAPGAGIAARVGDIAARSMARHPRPAPKLGHSGKAILRSRGISHQRHNAMMIAMNRRTAFASVRRPVATRRRVVPFRRPMRRRVQRRMVM